MSTIVERVDFGTAAKLRFAAIVLPVLGTLGGVLKVNGQSDEVVLMVVVPLLFVGFFGWRLVAVLRSIRDLQARFEKQFWVERDARATRHLQDQFDAQGDELLKIRRRQQAEQDRMLSQNASTEQLANLMERHRGEYEALFNRRTA